MKKCISIIAFLFASLTFAADTLPVPNSSAQPLDRVIAHVNDSVITQSKVDIAYKNTITQIKKHNIQVPDESTLKNAILNQLIYQKLQLQLAARNHITVTNAQIDTTIKNIAKEHKMSVATLKQKIQQEGSSYSNYRHEIKKQILISMVQHQALASKVTVSDAELNQFFNQYKSQKKYAPQYHLIDILVSPPPAPTSPQEKQTKTEALKIAKSLRQGASTSSIHDAKIHDLGWRTKMDLPDIFLQQLPKMKSGGIVGPLLAPNGYHIIKLMGIKKSSSKLPSRNEAKQLLMEKKFESALRKWLMKLRKQSYVNIIHPQ